MILIGYDIFTISSCLYYLFFFVQVTFDTLPKLFRWSYKSKVFSSNKFSISNRLIRRGIPGEKILWPSSICISLKAVGNCLKVNAIKSCTIRAKLSLYSVGIQVMKYYVIFNITL